jgi:hypothetical protein
MAVLTCCTVFGVCVCASALTRTHTHTHMDSWQQNHKWSVTEMAQQACYLYSVCHLGNQDKIYIPHAYCTTVWDHLSTYPVSGMFHVPATETKCNV